MPARADMDLKDMAPSSFPELTLPQMLREQARRTPDRIAVRQKDFGIWNPVSWAAYFERSAAVGHGLRKLGLSQQGHLAILSENRVEWVLAQLGAGMIGAVAIGVYPTSPANEVGYVLEHSDAEIIVCEDQEQVDKVLEVRDQRARLKKIVVVEKKGMRAYPGDIVVSFDAVEELGAADRKADPGFVDACLERQTADDIALMIYTSGSTGKPKAAMLSYRNIRAQAIAVADLFGITPEMTHLSYLPLCHVAEQMMTTFAPIYCGTQINFGESLRTVQEDLREIAPSMFLGVPRIWEKLHSSIHVRMLDSGLWRRKLFDWAYEGCEPFAEKPRSARTPAEKLRYLISYMLVFRALQNYIGLRKAKVAMTGAAPISPRIVRFFRTIGVPLVEIYGATETGGVAIGQRVGDVRSGCVGTPLSGVEARLGDQDEVLVRGDTVFSGYYKAPEATEATIRDGWLHTGDVAVLEGGQYRIVDRLKDIMITAGGKNLSPSEIENTVKGSPYIKECIVIAEARKFVSALIQIDYETVGKWAEEERIAYTNFRNLSENPGVRELVEKEIAIANAQLAQVAGIKRFHLLTKELDHDDDEVTATMKVRRSNIQKKYTAEIEALYARA
jgi:long-chain acyl-CoA synthetase